MHKERFPSQRKSKLQPRGDGPFQVMERINDNAYKLDLKGESNVNATFNVADLVPFDFDVGFDSRMNLLEEGGNYENQGQQRGSKDHLQGIRGPILKNRVKYTNVALSS